jgi:hypothetical protein
MDTGITTGKMGTTSKELGFMSKGFKFWIICCLILEIFSGQNSAAVHATPAPVDRKSNQFVADVFNSSNIIGVFEVLNAGPKVPGEVEASYTSTLKLRPVEILKGKVGKVHSYEFNSIDHGKPVPFLAGKKYLMAFDDSNGRCNIRGACGHMFHVSMDDPDAKFYLEKFKSLQRAK